MKFQLFLFVVYFSLPLFVVAQPEAHNALKIGNKKSKVTLFQTLSSDAEIPKIVLTTDMNGIVEQKFSGVSIPSKLKVKIGDQEDNWDIEIETRGKSRRRICQFPPLRLKFSKNDLKEKGIRKKYNSLKLVSYCKDSKAYENFILKEYQAYKIYQELTKYSFKVQLVQIEYRDVFNKVKPVIRYGFLIENKDEMAHRLNAKEKTKYQVHRDSLDHFQYDVLAMYQYMISNTDWKVNALHNIKIIQDKDTKIYYAIPYDFDFSGLVDAEYALPNPDYNQVHIKNRIYLGECKSPQEFEVIRQYFLEKKDQILALESDCISEKQRKKSKKFLRSFYDILESDKKFKKKLLKH